MISDIYAPATHAQRVADANRGARINTVLGEANALRSCSSDNRSERRELIRGKLAECDDADRQRVELTQYRQQLEVKREQAIEDHAIEAAKIQAKLAKPELTVEQRIQARQELNVINTALAEAIADIEAKDFATEQEDADLQVISGARSTLVRALRDTCEPELQAQLESAERVYKGVLPQSRAADKALKEAVEYAQYQQSYERERLKREGWCPLMPPTEDLPPSTPHIERLKADAKRFGEIACRAASDVDRLKKLVMES